MDNATTDNEARSRNSEEDGVDETGWTDSEEIDEDHVYEDDRREYGIVQCLPVDDEEPDFGTDDAMPETVEEYLRRVRYEARNLPAVSRSHMPEPTATCTDENRASSSIYINQSLVTDCDPLLKPSVAWIQRFLIHFSMLRKTLLQPKRDDNGDMHNIGKTWIPTQDTRSNAVLESIPELKEYNGMRQVKLQKELQSTIAKLDSETELSEDVASKLYVMLLCLEYPCHSDVSASLRSLVRKCCEIRSTIHDTSSKTLGRVNVILVIAGGFFGQNEELASMWESTLE